MSAKSKKTRRRAFRWADQIPPMKCDEGCGECCGIVPATPREFEAIRKYAAASGIAPQLQDATCPWYQSGKCTVYKVRPLMCRVFGHARRMPCPRGHNVNISEEKVRAMLGLNGPCEHILHDHLVEAGIVESIKDALGEELAAIIPTLLPGRASGK